jgi:DNA-binding MarR family transcriptional regulator
LSSKLKATAIDEFDANTGLRLGSLGRSIRHHLYFAQRASANDQAARLKALGAASRNVTLLVIIELNPGAAQGRIAEAIKLDRTTIVPIIDDLEKEGFVERRPSAKDKRSKGLWLTQKGKQTVVRVKAMQAEHEANLVKGLSKKEQQALLGYLRHLTQNAAGTSAGRRASALDEASDEH